MPTKTLPRRKENSSSENKPRCYPLLSLSIELPSPLSLVVAGNNTQRKTPQPTHLCLSLQSARPLSRHSGPRRARWRGRPRILVCAAARELRHALLGSARQRHRRRRAPRGGSARPRPGNRSRRPPRHAALETKTTTTTTRSPARHPPPSQGTATRATPHRPRSATPRRLQTPCVMPRLRSLQTRFAISSRDRGGKGPRRVSPADFRTWKGAVTRGAYKPL